MSHDHSSHAHDHEHEHFSLPLFTLTVVLTLGVLGGVMRWFFPDLWAAQLAAPVWKGVCVFVAISLFNAFMEYFFHRYVLHTPAVPFLRRMYRQHTLHHALTRIIRKRLPDGNGVLVIENKFPIVEPEQGEASFFPWYSLAVFALVLTPVLAALQWLFPSFPWFVGGFLALTSSLALYEILHAINHWPIERWAPLMQHPRWGRFWRPIYGFHLRHHAVIDCNESISGFFGLPVADWVFGTCVIPKTVYADGEASTPETFASPKPVGFIRALDRWAAETVRRQRAAEAARSSGEPLPDAAAELRPYTRGEEIANWVTHGIGLALSVVAMTFLVVLASLRGDAWHVVSFTVFGLTLLLLYTASTLYHAQRSARARSIFRRLDHAAIFLLIAGTYTPFLLTSLRGPWGWTLFGIVWGVATAGAVFKLIFGDRYRAASIVAYLCLGWLVVVALKPLQVTVPTGGVALLVAGGVFYSLGVLFYVWRRLRYHHAVWHAFVLGGSTCHFLSVLLFLLPKAA